MKRIDWHAGFVSAMKLELIEKTFKFRWDHDQTVVSRYIYSLRQPAVQNSGDHYQGDSPKAMYLVAITHKTRYQK